MLLKFRSPLFKCCVNNRTRAARQFCWTSLFANTQAASYASRASEPDSESDSDAELNCNKWEAEAQYIEATRYMNASLSSKFRHLQATEYLAKAARSGNAKAAVLYSCCLEHGLGVRRDVSESWRYLKVALQQDNADAQFIRSSQLLGELKRREEHGQAVAQKLAAFDVDECDDRWLNDEARRLLAAAAAQGHVEALCTVATSDALSGDARRARGARRTLTALVVGKEHVGAMCALARLELDEGNGQTAVKLWRRAAELGSVAALVKLGDVMRTGAPSVPADLAETLRCWRCAALEHRNGAAMCALAGLYQRGEGVDVDAARAAELWRTAADECQNALGAANYGIALRDGIGVTHDWRGAHRYLERGTALGNPVAHYALGVHLEHDRGELAQATDHYGAAAAKGHADAQLALGRLAQSADRIDEALRHYEAAASQGNASAHNAAGLLLARRHRSAATSFSGGGGGDDDDANAERAIRHFEAAAALGHCGAAVHLAELLYSRGADGDYERAAALFAEHAERGDIAAQFGLALCHQHGRGVPGKDVGKACALLRSAADAGHVRAQNNLGALLELGSDDVEQDLPAAVAYFRRAASAGHPYAAFNLAQCLRCGGPGIEQDLGEAIGHYRQAADRNVVDAHYQLGICLALGEGVEANLAAALEHWRTAASHGHSHAARLLHQFAKKVETK
jgi:uncharacterized protein